MNRLLFLKSALGLVLAFVLVASAVSATEQRKRPPPPPLEPFKSYMEDDADDLSEGEREEEEKLYRDRLMTDQGLIEEYFPRLERINFDDLDVGEDEFDIRDRIKEMTSPLPLERSTEAPASVVKETRPPVTGEDTPVPERERDSTAAPVTEDTTVPQRKSSTAAPVTEGTTVPQRKSSTAAPVTEGTTVPQRKSSTAAPVTEDAPVPQRKSSTVVPATEKGPAATPPTGKSISSLFGLVKNRLQPLGKMSFTLPSILSKGPHTEAPARVAEKDAKTASVVPTESSATQEGASVAPEEASLDEIFSLESDTEGDKPSKDTIKEEREKPRTDASSKKSKPRLVLSHGELTEEEEAEEDHLLEILERAIAREGKKKKSKVTEPTKTEIEKPAEIPKTEKPVESLPSQLVKTAEPLSAKGSSQIEVDTDEEEEVHEYEHEEEEDEGEEDEGEEDELP